MIPRSKTKSSKGTLYIAGVKPTREESREIQKTRRLLATGALLNFSSSTASMAACLVGRNVETNFFSPLGTHKNELRLSTSTPDDGLRCPLAIVETRKRARKKEN